MSDEGPTTDELRRRQLQHELEERELAAEAATGAESENHRRRAEKAGYLRRKLEERERVRRLSRAYALGPDRSRASSPSPWRSWSRRCCSPSSSSAC